MRIKLKAVYTLVEQLYTGAQRTITAAMHKKHPPTLIKDTLAKLSVLPQRIDDLNRASARASALTALSRAKAWQADLDPEGLANGCPSVKEDGSPFNADDFAEIAREMRPLASKLAEETNLSQYQAAYDAENKKIKASVHQEVDLISPTCKHTFAPDIDPSNLIDDEAVFRALTGINWSTPDFQPMDNQGADEEEAQDDPEASTRQDS
jgi:hypothetical protein